jgi:hypothetical protein
MTGPAAKESEEPVLDAEHVAFLARAGISSAVAARDDANQPSVAKGLGVRVSADRRLVEVFVDTERAAPVLRDLRAGSPVAVVCSEPASHRTIQLKGERARIEEAAADDLAFVAGKVQGVIAHIAPLGYKADALRVYFSFTPAALAKVVFAPVAAFLQTPGPGAGAPLKP